jgi:hypothetical protein
MGFEKLYKNFPELLSDPNIIEIDDGWYIIVEDMLSAIKIYQEMNLGKSSLIPTLFTKIKAKQGWLEIEYSGGDEVVAEIVKFCRILSFKTCEVCGKIGQLYCSEKWMHWSNKKTLCTDHAVKLFYYTLV